MAKRNMSRNANAMAINDMRAKKVINNDVEIEIMNNMDCRYSIFSEEMTPKLKTLEIGATTRLTWKELNALHSEKPKHLSKMHVMVTDVINIIDHTGVETDVEVDDVLHALNILPLYENYRKMITDNVADGLYDSFEKGEYPSYTDIRTLILKSDAEKFKKVMNDVPKQFLARILEIVTILYRKGEFNDMNKAKIINEITAPDSVETDGKITDHDFFADHDLSLEYVKENDYCATNAVIA